MSILRRRGAENAPPRIANRQIPYDAGPLETPAEASATPGAARGETRKDRSLTRAALLIQCVTAATVRERILRRACGPNSPRLAILIASC
jgi:hypothetical protein